MNVEDLSILLVFASTLAIGTNQRLTRFERLDSLL